MTRMPARSDSSPTRPARPRALAAVLALTMIVEPLPLHLAAVAGLAIGAGAAGAAPIVDPYAPARFQPAIVLTGGGVPVVHITAPNAAGISYNRFQRFDVPTPGLVLNNSLTGGGTLLGIYADGNPNLAGRTASLILNEVTAAGAPSELRGPTEVFGDPARVVIANPNGISCSGCAFINTPRLTLTSGVPRLLAAPGGSPSPYESASALAYDVRSGHVQVSGPELDLGAGRLDIVAETIGIDAPLRAKTGAEGGIELVAGRGMVAESGDGGHTIAPNGAVDAAAAVRAANPSIPSVADGIAIDATALGAMSAGTIRILATTAGLGVRAAGPLAAVAGALVIGSNGDLHLAPAYAAQDLRLDAAGHVAASSNLLAARNVTIAAGGDLTVAGKLQAGTDMRLGAQDLATADLLAGGRLDSAAARHTLGGVTSVLGDARLQATGAMTVRGDMSIGGALDVAAGSLVNHAIVATGSMNKLTAESIANRGTIYGAGVELTAGTLDNGGGRVLADGDLSVGLANLAANDAGLLAAGRDVRLTASGDFAGQGGTLAAGRDLSLSLPGIAFDALTAGRLHARGRLSVDVSDFVNGGTWQPAASSVSVRATGAFSNTGGIETAGDLSATAGGSIHNAGRLLASGTLALTSPALANRGELLAGAALTLNGELINRGAIAAGGDVTFAGASLDNAGGRIQSDRNLSLTVSDLLNNTGGSLASLGDAALSAGRIFNDRTEPAGTVSVSRGRDAALLDGVVLLADPRVTLADLAPDYAAGKVFVAREPTLGTTDRLVDLPETVRTETSQAHGTPGRIVALGDATIRADGPISNRGGEMLVRGNLQLAASALDSGRSADLINGVVTRTDAADLDRFVAELNAARGAGLSVQTGVDPLTGELLYSTVPAFASNPATAGTPAVTPGLGGSIQAGGSVSLKVGGLIQEGTLTAGNRMIVDNSGPTENAGTIAAAGDLTLTSANLSNAAGARLLAGHDMSLGIAGSLLNRSALIEAGHDLAIAAGTVSNLDAGPVTTSRTYRVDTPAGYQDDKWFTYAEYRAGVEWLVADPNVRSKLLAPEYLADYVNYEGSHRIRLAGPADFYMDSGLTEPTFDLILTRRHGRGTITAGRDLDLFAQSLVNDASLINAGGNLSARVGALANSATTDEYRLFILAGEWSDYRVYAPAAAALQAGSSLTVAAAGSIVNSGNVFGQAIALSGSELTNGLTDPRIPPITSAQPGAVIPLLPPDLGTNPAGIMGTPPLTLAPVAIPNPGDLGGNHPPPSPGDLTARPPGAGPRFLHTSPVTSTLAPLGPDYLLSLLPAKLAQGRELLFLADPAVEQQLLRQAAIEQTGRAYFINGLAYDDQLQVSADTQQRAAMYEAAARFAADNGLAIGQGLSPEQVAALDRPMLWYVEQGVPDGTGGTVRALVPTVYLPRLDREHLTNVAGGLIKGGDVSLDFSDRVTNTGYLAADRTLSISAREFINAKRNADFGKQYQEIEGGWIDITGTRVQPGAFISAANLQIRASRIQSVSGEFEVIGSSLAETQQKSAAYLDQLRRELGSAFSEKLAQDELHFEVHQKRKYDWASIAAMAVGIAVAVLTEGAGSFLLDLQAGSVAATAADAAVSAMASSAASGVVTGDFSVKDVLRAGLAGGLTAGLSFGIGEALGNETLTGGKLIDRNLVRAAEATTTLTDKLVGYAVRAGVSAGTQKLVYGEDAGSFGDAFLNSVVGSAAADAANWVGTHTEPQTLENILAHGAVGCAAAAAVGRDCVAGALGGMTSATVAPALTKAIAGTTETDGLTQAQRAAIAGSSVLTAGLVAEGLKRGGQDAGSTAANEVINNWLHPKERDAAKMAAKACSTGDAAACETRLSLLALDSTRESTVYARTSGGFMNAIAEAGGATFLAPLQIATALVDGNLLDVAVETLKAVADLPADIAAGLASDVPEARGRAVAHALMVGVGVAQLGRVAAGRIPAPTQSLQAHRLAGETNDARIFTSFYSEGSAVDIGSHFSAFELGGSYLVPRSVYEAYVSGKPFVGRLDGQFLTSKSAMDELLTQTGGNAHRIKERLGIPANAWMEDLIRIDVARPLDLNPRLPTGLELGANNRFVRGGFTSGNMPEIVVDQIPSQLIRATPVAPTGAK